ncbi:MAG: transcription-repair coupling factor [Lentimicrobiaceae bacterium]|nr:transcription-repair coupling factor [Lentimicrobiaceae bacterium]
MKTEEFLSNYQQQENLQKCIRDIRKEKNKRLHIEGLTGSSAAIVATVFRNATGGLHVLVLPDKETAAYFFNDLETLNGEREEVFHKKNVLFYPTSYKRPYEIEKIDNTNVLLRTEVLKRLASSERANMVVTYPEALCEKVITQGYLQKNSLKMKVGEKLSFDFVADLFTELDFERVDFVAEPGEFSIRGGIVDVFSYTNDYPYRIEFFGDEVESIRSFQPETQLSIDRLDHITIVPNMQNRLLQEKRISFFKYMPENVFLWMNDFRFATEKIQQEYEKAEKIFGEFSGEIKHLPPEELFTTGKEFTRDVLNHPVVEFGKHFTLDAASSASFQMIPQPSFNKNFEMFINQLLKNSKSGMQNIIVSDNPKQLERLQTIIDDLCASKNIVGEVHFSTLSIALHEGFIDKTTGIACYTDHQLFERYHRFQLKDNFSGKQALTLKEIYNLQPGDFVTHIDHGIGRFTGLEKIINNGKIQEAIRLVYKDNDMLYVSIHSLHRISKYVGKDGLAPSLNKLGSNAWNKLKTKTKQRVKDIAKELIQLYAKRKSAEGFLFSPDTYLQHELEASFIYEDTPDQLKTILDVKKDMEQPNPMDRLVCGDVGFGKTEIAIRSAFKAVNDSKQVAVLVPTTILALQHYKTFSERLKDLPCTVDYLNRFKTTRQQHETLSNLEKGKVDILVGTHRLISKDVKFKDLGLLVIDEEQKFGVAVKEKLKAMKVNVDTLTLTATPIPRTLQFSLMGARDLSIINTPPPNRYPVQTEVHTFNEETIRDAISYELSRGGQVFFVNNRIQNLMDITGMIQRVVPDCRIAIGHGQMEGNKLEKIMLDFIEGEYDVLVSTTIIESGLDIPNVNTIIINDAHHYGLSDLHQLRGRVGRTNKKAFCYLLAPPLSVLTDEARKRLKAIEEFSKIGSGFNIAMRDLAIRGAGNLLGAEQSGFISDIGFEMYHRILDEAILELKETEFKDIFHQETPKEFVRECQIETDLEIHIPDDYISNITERLSLYKELDNINKEEDLMAFQERLIDRFGPVPKPVLELMNTLRLRWMARSLGFEKIVMKNAMLSAYFVSNQESPYYQSAVFGKVLQFVKQNPAGCRMKETGNKLTLSFLKIQNIGDALRTLMPLAEVQNITNLSLG